MAQCAGWSLHHIGVFVITFFAYATYNAARKTFSTVKSSIQTEWAPIDNATNLTTVTSSVLRREEYFLESADEAEVFFGVLDTLFLMSYAVGLYVCGVLGDRFNLRNVLACGMCLSALSIFMFGTVSEWVNVYSKSYYIIFWILNGLLQGTGLPASVAILGKWFGSKSRGLMFGTWSACQSVGNIMGTTLSALVVEYGFEYSFLATSSLLFIGGIIVLLFLVPSPNDVGLLTSAEAAAQMKLKDTSDDGNIFTEVKEFEQNEAPEPLPIGFVEALQLPGVVCYALSYAFLKLVNYAFFFWLPFYLTSTFGWTERSADAVSIFYDIGGIIGGTVAGFLSDRIGVRSPVVIIMLVFSYFVLYWYSVSPDYWIYNACIMTLLGFFINGNGHLVSVAVPADLGQQDGVRGNCKALATVTGIVDGTGTVGAAVGQMIVPFLELNYGWPMVFYFFIGMNVCSTIFLLPVLLRDVGTMSQRFSGGANKESTSLLHNGKAN